MSTHLPEATTDSRAAEAPERWWHRHRLPVGITAAAVATGLAATWLVVVPDRAAEVGGLQRWTLQYAHSVCWALLAIAAGLFAARGPRRVIDVVARGALASYAAFLLALWV